MTFDKESFDGIWYSDSLLHFETLDDVIKSLEEFYRVLKSGGILCVSVKKKLGKKESEAVVDSLSRAPRFFRWFTEKELISLLEKVGFKRVEICRVKDMAGRRNVEFITTFAFKK